MIWLDGMCINAAQYNSLTGDSILTPYYASGQHSDYPTTNFQQYNLADSVEVGGKRFVNKHVDVRGENHHLARKMAAESTVSVMSFPLYRVVL
jgi:hypothetical protein